MKPSIQDIKSYQEKANFINWLILEFGENEFTNSEMKKHYNEAVTRAIENAFDYQIVDAIREFESSIKKGVTPYSVNVSDLRVNFDAKTIYANVGTDITLKHSYSFYKLARLISPVLDFSKSFTLNSTFENSKFFSKREENTIYHLKRATGIVRLFQGIPCCGSLNNWDSEEELKSYFIDGKCSIEENDIETFRFVFRLNIAKAAQASIKLQKAAQNAREERTRCLAKELAYEDRHELLEYLADSMGYNLS